MLSENYPRKADSILGFDVGPQLRAALDDRALYAYWTGQIDLNKLAELLSMEVEDAKRFSEERCQITKVC